MKRFKIGGIILIAGFIMTFGFAIGELFSIPGATSMVPKAEARVGRPLTPVSVAGVARRTARRCRAGVYNCGISDPRSLDSLQGQISLDPICHFLDVKNKGTKG